MKAFLCVASLSELPESVSAAATDDDRASVTRYRRALDRDVRIAALGLLRSMIPRVAPSAPAASPFAFGEQGKPYLPGGPPFNLSHSGDRVAVVVASDGRVGVDVEVVREVERPEELAGSVFTGAERRALAGYAEGSARSRAFLRGWTRKEALVKASGIGIADDRLLSFGVSLEPGSLEPGSGAPGSLAPVSLEPGSGAPGLLAPVSVAGAFAEGWRLLALVPPSDIELALAWDQPTGEVVMWRGEAVARGWAG